MAEGIIVPGVVGEAHFTLNENGSIKIQGSLHEPVLFMGLTVVGMFRYAMMALGPKPQIVPATSIPSPPPGS